MVFRRPTADELRLLKHLATIAKLESVDAWLAALRVRDMDDGGMGSLEIEATSDSEHPSTTVICLASVQFTDADGVEVIASLNAREDGVPFELDMWKTDSSRLIRIPDELVPS